MIQYFFLTIRKIKYTNVNNNLNLIKFYYLDLQEVITQNSSHKIIIDYFFIDIDIKNQD